MYFLVLIYQIYDIKVIIKFKNSIIKSIIIKFIILNLMLDI